MSKNAVQSLAPLAAFVAVRGDPVKTLALAFTVGMSLITVVALLRYWFFRYCITDHSILIRDGVLKRKQLDVGFDRIQAVNTTQNLLYRILGLTTVTFDSAGSSAEEGYLPAVRNDVATALRDRIRRTSPQHDAAGAETEKTPVAPRELLRLSGGDIALAGLSSGRAFLLLAVLGPFLEPIEKQIGQRVEETAIGDMLSAIHPDLGSGILLVILLVAAVFLVLLAFSVAGAFLRYHGFSLRMDGDVLRSVGGLFTRQEHSVGRAKVQTITVVHSAVLRLCRRFRVRIRQASSGRSARRRDFQVPVCRLPQVREIAGQILLDEYDELPVDPSDTAFAPISGFYVRSRLVLFGVLPLVVAVPLLWLVIGWPALSAVLWLPACALVVRAVHRRYGISVTSNGIALRSGFVGSRIVVWLHRKVQRVTVTQSPFQRRRNLATLRFYLAAGAFHIPFVDYSAALRLRDFVLYRVESSDIAWH